MRSQGIALLLPTCLHPRLAALIRVGERQKIAKIISPTDFSPGLHLPVFSAVAIPNSKREPFR